ncbi:hypothetical protein PENPOL_c015G06730 [Penicillium polonicum]|uniref:Aldehyde dehydrogenase domain-containing protein n=1 Tax=Penicillium polonicum TaxID=60169 RepID=A0A1V6NAL3_PENPO|nr:hypothetical protein PENPOL_c015G06730 [Penicillium polonicum]
MSSVYISYIGLRRSLATYNSNCFICSQATDRSIVIVPRYLINAVKLMKANADRIASLRRVGFQDGETQILTGGKRLGDKGCFFEPTVLCNPDPQAKMYKDEIFGPVACVRTFKTEEEFVEIAIMPSMA